MPSCSNCKKHRAPNEPIRECCTGTYYCNRKCERADFRKHKDHCPKLIPEIPTASEAQHAPQDASQSTSQNTPQSTSQSASQSASQGDPQNSPTDTQFKRIEDPFNRLKRGVYLQNRADMNVFEILIDSYRLRMDDNERYAKVHHRDSIYGGAQNGMQGFRNFLNKAKTVPHLLPYSWDNKKQIECEAMGRTQGWSSLSNKIKDVDVNEHYQDKHIVMQLRLLAEDIYGTSIGDKPKRVLRDQIEILPDSCSNAGTDAFLRMALADHQLKLIFEDLPEGLEFLRLGSME
ncbi:hypothetical protein F4678DRAFT_483855 [Xylaria arbuscula]|nr:hypothetical protein F4678DRAFT_483855 [Xylaria arbuscula]